MSTKSDADAAAIATLVERVRHVARQQDGAFVPLHEPRFAGNEWAYVKDCLDSGWVSSVGRYVDRFEADLAARTGAARAVAVVNGTAALHLALLLVGVRPGDEVIVPTLTFVATANAVRYCGAIPHFADSDDDSLGLDPIKLAEHLDHIAEPTAQGPRNRLTGRRIAAIVPMHTFGHAVDLDPLVRLCADWNLPLVEDAAESLGSTYHGRHTGTFGQVGTLSFNGNKIITTGGGGALLFSDPDLADRAKHLSTTAKLPHRWRFDHDAVGFNYRLPNINAALGCAQLELLDGFVAAKRALAARYRQSLADLDGVQFVDEPANRFSNFWLNAIRVDPSRHQDILAALNDANLMSRPAWTLMHLLPVNADCPRQQNMDVAENIAKSIINIPSSPILGM